MTTNATAKLPMSTGRRLVLAWRDQDGQAIRNVALGAAVIAGLLAYVLGHTLLSVFSLVLWGVAGLALVGALTVYLSAWKAAPTNGYRVFQREQGRALESAGSESARRALAASWQSDGPQVNLDGIPMNGAVDVLGRAYGVLDTGVAATPSSAGSWLAPGHEYSGPSGMRD